MPRAKVYVTRPTVQGVARYDLATGANAGEITFKDLTPMGFGFAPGHGSLYVGLTKAVDSGYIAEIDLETFAEIRRFPVGIAPFDVAAAPGKIVVSDAYNQWTRIETYDLASGTLLGNVSGVIREASHLAMHPSFQRVYASGGGRTHRLEQLPSGEFGRAPSEFVEALSGDGVWVFPEGNRLITPDGAVYTSDAVSTSDLRLIAQLDDSSIGHVVFDTPHRSFFTVHSWNGTMAHRNAGTHELARRYFLPTNTLSVVVATNELWSLAQKASGQISFRRLANPAVGAETNTPPLAILAISPAATTLNEVVLDASGSTDDAPGLLARWDFDGDGIFDRDFSTNLVFRTNFNIPGPRTVIVQIKDRFGELSSATNRFDVQQADDPGLPPAIHAAFELPYRASLVAFDTTRDRMYATDGAGMRLRVTDLRTGMETRQYRFTREPESLVITPDAQRLYVVLRASPRDALTLNGDGGFVAEFDLRRGVKTREWVAYDDPVAIAATDQHVVIIRGRSGQLGTVAVSEPTAGGPKGVPVFQMASALVLHPALDLVYGAYEHADGTIIQPFEIDPVTHGLAFRAGLSMNVSGMKGFVSVSEDARWILANRGQFVGLRPDGGVDWPPTAIDPRETKTSIFARPALKMIITAAGNELRWTHRDTQYRAATVPMGSSADFLGRKDDTIWAVTLAGPAATVIRTVTDPTAAAEGNQPPLVRLAVSPASPTTLGMTTIDAGPTTDDNTPREQLAFRWDVGGDGSFEVDWTNQPVFSRSFFLPGPQKVSVQVRDKWGAVSTNDLVLDIALEADPGEPAPGHMPFHLSRAAAAWAFDPVREEAWLAFPADNKLVLVDLRTGLAQRQWTLPVMPGSLAITPDGTTLYVALLVQPTAPPWALEFYGYVAEFDLVGRVMTRIVRYGIAPGDIAATDRFLFVAGGSGGLSSVNAYDRATGLLIGQAAAFNGMRITAAPSQNKVFGVTVNDLNPYIERFAFNAAKGTFGPGVRSQAFMPEINGSGGRVFVLPGETNVLGGGGGVFLDRPGSAQDLRVVANLTPVPSMGFTEVPGANQFAVVSGSRIAYYTNGT
ncbi:MAG: esterase-like activity of phytase family protein, partial [Verrucomicrobia bacterium]